MGTFYLSECLLRASAQEVKKAMTFDEMVSWKRITEQKISHDGKWVACKMEPWRGDASIFVYNAKGEMTASFLPGCTGRIFCIFRLPAGDQEAGT